MKLIRIALVLSFFSFISCKSQNIQEQIPTDNPEEVKAKVDAVKQQGNPLFVFKRTPCFGTCPIYTVSVYSSKQVIINAENFTKPTGEFVVQMEDAVFTDIQKQLNEMDFFGFEKEYNCNVTDIPGMFFSYQTPENNHQVMVYCNGPEPLVELAKTIDGWIISNSHLVFEE